MNQYSKWHTVTYLGLEVKYANVVFGTWVTSARTSYVIVQSVQNSAADNTVYCAYHFLRLPYLPSYSRVCHSDSHTDNISKGNECMLFILSVPWDTASKNLLKETL